MRTSFIASILLATGCLAGQPSKAQRAPIAPLAPVTPVVAPPRSGLEVEYQQKQPATSAPTATTPPQRRPTTSEPVIILNGRYLMGMNALGAMNPQQIDRIEVYRIDSGPVKWRTLAEPGIMSITMKAKPRLKLKARSLVAIKRGLGLRGPVRFEFNGAPIQDESLQIATSEIAGLDVTQATPGTADKTVVNIRSVPYKPAVHHYPPGTIMIRGLAQQ